MVIDTSRLGTPKMFITKQVAHLEIADGMWHITFETSPISYTYRYERIKFFTKVERIDIETRGFYLKNKRIEDIRELYRFGDTRYYYHAVFSNGAELDYDEKDVYVSRTTLDECGGDTWKYLNQLAAETGLEMEGIGNILKMQYDIVDRMRDNVPLAQFIGDKTKLATYNTPRKILYPFGCNASQKRGVENALTHQVSIIQGPPGTGKTQTILNIVANLLVQGKSVLIVSNNNSAVENVAEKLSDKKIGLGFLVAQLGKKENKEAFVENQPAVPDISDWELPEWRRTAEEINEKLQIVSKGFEKQTILSKLKIEAEALKIESRYNELQKRPIVSDFDWLHLKPSRQLLTLKRRYETQIEQSKKLGTVFYIEWLFRLGFKMWTFLHQSPDVITREIEAAYYTARKNEIESEIADCESFLKSIDITENVSALRDLSLQMLKHQIFIGRQGRNRRLFSVKDIKPRTEEFLKEYPVVLSTIYTAKNCIDKNWVFDYVIMDEASQVDITTGALALSCAMNAVIVGDDKQLPNVIDERTKTALKAIESAYRIDEKYRSTTHSFLQSCCEVFTDAPQTLLREHYRCHPKIIEFCNHLFYNGELVPMTQDKGEENVVTVIQTAKGQHARGHYNQREIDVIQSEVLPNLTNNGSVGIITPYRNQAEAINRQLGTKIASTVHKYQGRECDNIIMSMVDNTISEFSDDPNLLNVAISRAQSRLFVVTNGNQIKEDSNLGQLIAYARYNNFEVKESKLHSVFDLLYKQYTTERLKFELSKSKNTGELSENIIYHILQKSITKLRLTNTDILCHYPLSRLIANDSLLNDKEKLFANNPMTHIDFLLYNSLTKIPLLCIEVDGWHFHRTDAQQKRDQVKDCILDKYGLRLIRLSTVQTITEENLTTDIANILNERL